MKKSKLINSDISLEISKLGHTDGIVISDAGLPIPENVKRIDLAVKKGVPSFLDVLDSVLDEQRIEEIIIAKEMKEKSPTMYKSLIDKIKDIETKEDISIEIKEIDHEEFKQRTNDVKAIIRTGEYTPFANVILKSGVVF
ncbi:MAG: D-ribose pyranase [Firmicutes bacterium]|nr:D-ribose pyranase [Bacillota bacterium]